MVNQAVIDYIKKAKQVGLLDNQIKSALYKNGWTEAEVRENFLAISEPEQKAVTSQSIPIQRTPVETISPQSSPVQSSPVQSSPVQSNMPKKKAIMPLFVKLFIALIILGVLSTAGLFIAAQFLDFSWNPFKPSSEKVFQNMVVNMRKIKSLHTVTQGEISITNINSKDNVKLLFDIDSNTDITDPKNQKAKFTFKINSVSFYPMLAYLSLVVLDKTVYFKIDNLTPIDVSFAGEYASQIIGTWLKIDQNTIKTLSEVEGSQISQFSFLPEANQEIGQKIQDLIFSENIFVLDKQLDNEIINGQNTYHYSVKIPSEKLKKIVTKISALEKQTLPDFLMNKIGDLYMEVWIGQKNYLLYKYQIDKTITLMNVLPGTNIFISLKLNSISSNFNKPILVQVPENSKNLDDIVLPIIKLQNIQNEISEIGMRAKSIFMSDKSYYLLCKNGLLNGIHKDFGPGFLDIVNKIKGQGAKNPICFASINDYCISTQLADDSWLCIDKNGNLGKTECISSKTVCQ